MQAKRGGYELYIQQSELLLLGVVTPCGMYVIEQHTNYCYSLLMLFCISLEHCLEGISTCSWNAFFSLSLYPFTCYYAACLERHEIASLAPLGYCAAEPSIHVFAKLRCY